MSNELTIISPDELTAISTEIAAKPQLWVYALTKFLARQTPKEFISYHEGPSNTNIAYVDGAYAICTRAAATSFGVASDFEIIETCVEERGVSCLGKLTFKMMMSNGALMTTSSMQWGECGKLFGDTWGNTKKGAATDALKKCLSAFGWAADVYAMAPEKAAPPSKEDMAKSSIETLYRLGREAGKTEVQVDELVKEWVGKTPKELGPTELTAVKRRMQKLATPTPT